MKKLLSIFNSLSFSSTVVLGFLTFKRSQMPYNEEGRYFDETSAVLYDYGAYMSYMLFTIISAIVFLTGLIVLKYLKSNGK